MSAETVYYIAYLVSLAMNGALALFCIYLWLELDGEKFLSKFNRDTLNKAIGTNKKLQEKIDNEVRRIMETCQSVFRSYFYSG